MLNFIHASRILALVRLVEGMGKDYSEGGRQAVILPYPRCT